MTAPRWIAEALDAAMAGPGVGDIEVDKLAAALIERLPLEAMGRENSLTGIARVLSDGDPEVVELTELYQGACKALDAAGVPYASDPPGKPPVFSLVDRIKWLARERPIRAELESERSRRELAEDMAMKYMTERDAAEQRWNLLRIEREHFEQLAADLQASLDDMSTTAERLLAERDLARTMHQDAERAFAEAMTERDVARADLVNAEKMANVYATNAQDIAKVSGQHEVTIIELTAERDAAIERERQTEYLAEQRLLALSDRGRRAEVDATDRQVLRAKVADQAAYIEALELELDALEDEIYEDVP